MRVLRLYRKYSDSAIRIRRTSMVEACGACTSIGSLVAKAALCPGMVTLWSRRRSRRQSRKACRLRRHTLQLPRSFLAARFALRLCAFLSHRHGENCRAGEAGKGVWGKTWNRAAWGARGVPGFPPVRFRIGPPSCWSRSRAVVFPTSPSGPLGVGVRSGTWRRRAASASAQAGGGTETETRRTAPAHAGAVLYGKSMLLIWPGYGGLATASRA
jgi:hypothetical protein